jgi:hypothetical protein
VAAAAPDEEANNGPATAAIAGHASIITAVAAANIAAAPIIFNANSPDPGFSSSYS